MNPNPLSGCTISPCRSPRRRPDPAMRAGAQAGGAERALAPRRWRRRSESRLPAGPSGPSRSEPQRGARRHGAVAAALDHAHMKERIPATGNPYEAKPLSGLYHLTVPRTVGPEGVSNCGPLGAANPNCTLVDRSCHQSLAAEADGNLGLVHVLLASLVGALAMSCRCSLASMT